MAENKHNQIVYSGLIRLTDDRTVVREAYQYWQRELSNQAFDLVDIASKLIDYIGSDSSGRKTLMIAMHAANNKTTSELPKVPGFVTQQHSSLDSDNTIDDSPEINLPAYASMTISYFALAFMRLQRVNPSAHAELSEIIENDGLNNAPESMQESIKKSIDQGLTLTSEAGETLCQDLVHNLSLLISEVAGPVVADDIINNVIEELLESSKASQYDPRKLL